MLLETWSLGFEEYCCHTALQIESFSKCSSTHEIIWCSMLSARQTEYLACSMMCLNEGSSASRVRRWNCSRKTPEQKSIVNITWKLIWPFQFSHFIFRPFELCVHQIRRYEIWGVDLCFIAESFNIVLAVCLLSMVTRYVHRLSCHTTSISKRLG